MLKFWMHLLILTIIIISTVLGQDKRKVVALPEIKIKATTEVNQRLYDAFRKSFPDADHLSWYKYDKEYLAKFIIKDMSHNALFRQKGMMVYDISYGYEEHLPTDTRNLIDQNYDNYKIIRAINVRASGRNIWIVKLEGMKKNVTVRIEDQEIDEVESFTKV